MLKVVHLNTYDGNGGAGRACMRLNRALLSQGIDSKIIVHYKFGNNPQIKTFNSNLVQKAYTAATIIGERVLAKRYLKPGRTPFSFTWFGRSVIHHPDVKNADIIHLHWVNHDFLNPSHLAEIAELNKPIVWTFHDSNAFTGGCHVRYTCDHFQRQCGDCPLLKNASPNDISHRIWMQKNEAYQVLNFNIITPSLWMQGSVKASSLMIGKDVKQIPNTLETDIFRPIDKKQAKQQLGLPVDKFIFLSGFMPSRKDLHKGTSYLLDSLALLKERAGIRADQVELVIFGNRNTEDMPDFPFKTSFLGTISDDKKLAACYAAAHAFLIPSLEDNLPYTVMESLACGTPVIAFTTGGIPDMVQHEYNGYLAKYRSAESFADGMEWIIKHPEKEKLHQQARQTVMDNFAESIIADKHIKLYKDLLKLPHQLAGAGGLLSVITVVYNNVRDIERTMLSVLNQTYSNIEYIIVDGSSTDGTLEIIKRYESRITKLISEKDDGIYDAMNKGLTAATGDYVLFMNSADEFYEPDTVAKVFSAANDADIYYGETEMIDDKGQSLGQRRHTAPQNFTWRSFKYGMSVSHQAIYIRRSLTEPYDRQYHLSADIDWIIRAAKKAKKIVNVNQYVAKYQVGGMSKTKHRQSLTERFNIMKRYYGLLSTVFNHVVIAFNLGWYWVKNRRTND
ncbi:MAG: glycosyltransferase [Mucilaginibacter sp.]|nr:glycosyltransferase [Mucilaginibacter sp.]